MDRVWIQWKLGSRRNEVELQQVWPWQHQGDPRKWRKVLRLPLKDGREGTGRRKCLCVGVLALSLALQNPWKAESAWSTQFVEPWSRTSLASRTGYSQNQSQGIELDVHKEKVCAEMEGMSLTEVVADAG